MDQLISYPHSSIPVYLNDVKGCIGYIGLKGSIEKYLRDNSTNTTYYRITLDAPFPDFAIGVDKDEIIKTTNGNKTREKIIQERINSTKIYCFVVAAMNQSPPNSVESYTWLLSKKSDNQTRIQLNGAQSVEVVAGATLEFMAVDGAYPGYSNNLEWCGLVWSLSDIFGQTHAFIFDVSRAPQSADYKEIDNQQDQPPFNPDPPQYDPEPPIDNPKFWDFPFAKRNEYGIIEATLSGNYEGITFTVNSGESITWDDKLDPLFLIYGSTLATSVTATDKDGVSKTRPLESSDINSPSDDPFVFDDKNFLPDTEDTPPNWTNPFVDDWPAITFFHQQRLGFASSIKRPVTVWMSQPQAFECFATKTPPTAEDMIEATIASQQVNRINWASTDKGRLALGLDNAEWVLTGIDSEVCSPLSLKFTRYTEHGSAPYHKAIMTDAGLVHIKKDGQTVRTYSYTFSNDEYQSSDLTILARHLLADNPITSWAWQQEPLSTFYISTTQKNLLLNLTFLKEHDVVAWSAQIMNGEISSVINLLDDIYFIMKRRKANGAIVNTLEKVAPYFVLNGEIKSDKAFAIHLDSASLKGI